MDSLAYTLARYEQIKPAMAFNARTLEDAEAWQIQARVKLWELLGGAPADTLRVPLAPRYEPSVSCRGYTRTAVTIDTRPGLQAFGYLLLPDGLRPDEQRPGVLCLPGHGRGVDDIVGLNPDGTQRDHHDGYQHDFAVQLVERGFVVLALEMLGFGHRRDDAARRSGPSQTSCQPAAGAALLLGETMAGWRVWDATCAIDLLESRPDVNSERLAIAGISGGGTVGLYAAALDKRIKVAILSCSFCTFRDSIFSISHCIDNYVPGMLRWFEMADVAAMIAPRGLFCENGNRDEIFPEGAARRAADQTRQAFVVLGASDRFKLEINEGDHQFYGKGAFERLGPWLETTPLSY